MFKVINKLSLLFLMCICFVANAQQHEVTDYIADINARALNIVAKLDVKDADKKELGKIIIKQYTAIEKIESNRDLQLEKIKKSAFSEDEKKLKSEEVWTEYKVAISKLHDSYLNKLSKKLNDYQIVKVKDAMTYDVMPKTYHNFLDMFQNLNESQKKMIYDHLVEARENAMNAGTHKWQFQWFAKYRGKINNILASQGIELHNTSKAWEKKQLAKKNN
ncbi:DUF3826 domain-containing protein [Flavobacterium seoulense]|uniref:DUF3826 domain-containing protein n=1 Tax=Flavobacterium seoulense TaxID=1492738 RepID=A0A066WRT2_9FLAO|nr:DUF3826 domain-containing protein [Flavobacterium seoulense]KDN56516.1 hypothetical protein FEM21_00190 [Flavobacterium seoulense]